jgi:outer membrane lipoprotein SlyB
MKKIILIIVSLSVSLLISGCVLSSKSPNTYSRSQAGQRQVVEMGTVQHVREVEIEAKKSGAGAVAGGVIGGVVGTTIGQGDGKKLATLGGAVLGAILGHVAEEGITKEKGLEITVKTDEGETMAVVQGSDVTFTAGDRVRIITTIDGTTKITH